MSENPIDPDSRRQPTLSQRVAQICSAYREDCKSGGPRQLGEYLRGVGESEVHHFLVALLAVEEELCDTDLQMEPTRSICEADEPVYFGRYRVHRCLGKGGFGVVLLAHDEKLDRFVAIKIPHPHRITDPLVADVREAQLLAKLDHPSIVPVYDVGQTVDGRWYVVSKYIHGTTLRDVIQRDHIPWEQAAAWAADIAEALHYAHTRGVFHRDVKPSNILVDEQGAVFLADFGLALDETDMGSGPSTVGTLTFMSPEQLQGEADLVDGRSDVFSLGVTLYVMLTGRPPFAGQTSSELLHLIDRGVVRPPRQIEDVIPAELEAICLKALTKDRGQRYATAKDMAQDLRTVVQGGVRRPIVGRSLLALCAASMLVALPAYYYGSGWHLGGDSKSAATPLIPLNDRKAAEWVLHEGGTLVVSHGETRIVRTIDNLPSSDFHITSIAFGAGSDVSDRDLVRISQLQHLLLLDLNGTALSDNGMVHLKGLNTLQRIWLNFTNVSDKGLKAISGHTNLEHLDLNDTRVTDVGLKSLSRLVRLKYLDLSFTRVTDKGLPHLKVLRALEVLRLRRTGITDAGLTLLAEFPQLRSLELRDTAVSGAGVAQLQRRLNRCEINH